MIDGRISMEQAARRFRLAFDHRACQLLRWNRVEGSCACDGCCEGGCPREWTNARAVRPRARERRLRRRSRFQRLPRGVRILVLGWAIVTTGALVGTILGAIIHAVEQLLENLS